MKRIAVVSNNPHQVFSADFVDSCDEVMRFSNCVTYGGATGKKITGWVTRSRCNHTHGIYQLHAQIMRRAVSRASVALIAHGFPEYAGDGKLIGPEIVPYDEFPAKQLNPDISCVRMNARGLTAVHPGYNPTLGFILLWHVLHSNWFAHDELYLIGWNFQGIDDPHHIDWEEQVTRSWLERGYFKRYTP